MDNGSRAKRLMLARLIVLLAVLVIFAVYRQSTAISDQQLLTRTHEIYLRTHFQHGRITPEELALGKRFMARVEEIGHRHYHKGVLTSPMTPIEKAIWAEAINDDMISP